MSQQSAIESGNIRRSVWPGAESDPLKLYQGSGRSGASWNAWGLMGSAGTPHPTKDKTTAWMHADHWHRGNYGLDGWLHVGRLIWAGRGPLPPADYEQLLTLWDGRLTTRMAGAWGSICFCSFFDPGNPDVLAFEIEYDLHDGTLPSLLFEPSLTQETPYSGPIHGTARSVEHQSNPGWSVLQLDIGTARTAVMLRMVDLAGVSQLLPDPDGLGIRMEFGERRGRHMLWLGAAAIARKDELASLFRGAEPAQWAQNAREHWKKRWGGGWIQLPDPNLQALWARSRFYILSSYGADERSPAAPMGWSGHGWPYSFPQDLSYIHPALLRLGHIDIARKWVDFYHGTIPSMREATSRIYGAEGTMWAWEYPIGKESRILVEGAPNIYQYEIHNAAYPARMAFETAQHLNDPAWVREVAWEVVRESARFFASSLRRGPDGLWDLNVTPSMGQDEIDEGPGGNYLCSLFSAKYTLATAARFAASLGIGDDETGRWRRILADGLAFPRLLDPTGLHATREGIGVQNFLGRQKHPIQLNPLIFLPLGSAEEPTLAAQRRRHDLCKGSERREYLGWTLPAYWLSCSHLGDCKGLLDDLAMGVPSGNIDADWIQIYECSLGRGPYYMTSHGLYMQAVQDALVSDFWGETQLGVCAPPQWPEISFGGLRTSDGRVWNGERREGSFKSMATDGGFRFFS